MLHKSHLIYSSRKGPERRELPITFTPIPFVTVIISNSLKIPTKAGTIYSHKISITRRNYPKGPKCMFTLRLFFLPEPSDDVELKSLGTL